MQRSLARTSVIRLLLGGAALVVLGCGGGGGGGGTEVDKFVGVWEYDLSSVSQTCSDGTSSNNAGALDHVQREFFHGVKSDLVETSAALFVPTFPCNFRYKVANGSATIEAGQTCDIVDTSVATLDKIGVETPTSVTFALRGDGTELQENSTIGDATLDGSFNCTATIQGHLVKIAD